MGRARGGNTATAAGMVGSPAGRRQLTQVTTTTITIEQLITEAAMNGDPDAGLAGFENVADVQRLPNGLYRVTMADGSSAMVNLDELSVAHSSGDAANPSDVLGALYAAAGQRAMYQTDPATADPNDPMVALGDAYAEMVETDAPATPEQLAAFAAAAREALEANGGEVTLNPDLLSRLVSPEKPVSPRAAQRAEMARWSDQVQGIIDTHGDTDEAQALIARGLLHHTDPATGELIGMPTAEMLDEYKQAAAELGVNVPELKIHYNEEGHSDGDFEVGAAEKERIDIIRNALAYGDRFFAFRGPPGSGKGEMAAQIAAILGYGFVPINVGPSNDLEQNIGGDGLRAQVKEVKEPVLNTETGLYKAYDKDGKVVEAQVEMADGQPQFDEEGLPKLKGGLQPMFEKKQTVVTVSQTLYGPLTEALKRPCVIEIQEPEGMEQEAIRLHSALGEKIGRPDQRYISINSSAAGKEVVLPVHKDCIVIFTYNPGQEDIKLKQATHDRAVNLDFDYPTKEAEARRLARMVNSVLTNPDNVIPDGLRKPLEPETVMPFVGVAEKMRNASLENAAFIEAPGARQMARMVLQMMMQSYQGDQRGDRTARLPLDYCRSYNEKLTTAPDTLVTQILGDEVQALHEFNEALYNQGCIDRGEDPATAA